MHLLIYSVPYFPCKLYTGWVHKNACDSTYVHVQSNHINCNVFIKLQNILVNRKLSHAMQHTCISISECYENVNLCFRTMKL